jgi:hypothetical protein
MRAKLFVACALIAVASGVVWGAGRGRRPAVIQYPSSECTARAHIPGPGVIAFSADARVCNPFRESAVFWFAVVVQRLIDADHGQEVWSHSWDEPAGWTQVRRGGSLVALKLPEQRAQLDLPPGTYQVTVRVHEDVATTTPDGGVIEPAMAVCGDSAVVEVPGP